MQQNTIHGVYEITAKNNCKEKTCMNDIEFVEIKVEDNLIFILNKRGERPRLVHGIVREIGLASVLAEDDSGIFHQLHHSKRSAQDGRLLNTVVVHPKTNNTGEVKDCIGNSIAVGNHVAFMEVPSQSFSTALLTGTVQKVTSEGISIVVKSSAFRKYMRCPSEIVVIDTV